MFKYFKPVTTKGSQIGAKENCSVFTPPKKFKQFNYCATCGIRYEVTCWSESIVCGNKECSSEYNQSKEIPRVSKSRTYN